MIIKSFPKSSIKDLILSQQTGWTCFDPCLYSSRAGSNEMKCRMHCGRLNVCYTAVAS